jgi:hypothetical protein
MFGLPKDFPYEQIRGAKLLQVCIGMHDIIFNFTDNISISINSSIESGLSDHIRYIDFRKSAAEVSKLIDESISNASSSNGRDLELLFSNGHVLKIIDDSSEYESYIVNLKSKLIVV